MIEDDRPRNPSERRRLYLDAALTPNSAITLPPDPSHYLVRVLRLDVGAVIELFNSRDGAWRATIELAHKNHCVVRVENQIRVADIVADLWLVAAPLKKNRFETVIEKATELGVRRLLPIITRHSDVRDIRLDRLETIAIEAAEQCEGLSIPEITPIQSLETMLAQWPQDRILLVCCERGKATPIEQAITTNMTAGIAIGPAGGFHDDEITLMAQLPFVRLVSMGSRILRADTAAIAAVSVFLSVSGFWTKSRLSDL